MTAATAPAFDPPSRLLDLVEIKRWVREGTVRHIREQAGVPRTALAAELGVHESTVTRWEAGERVPRGEVALRYRRALVALRDGR